AVKLSHRYIPARQLPDKAVSLLDTACARVAVSQHATPAAVEDCQRRLEALATEQDIIAREQAIGVDVAAGAAQVQTLRTEAAAELATLRARWDEEKALVDRLLALRAQLRGDAQAVDPAEPGHGAADETDAAEAGVATDAAPEAAAADAPDP